MVRSFFRLICEVFICLVFTASAMAQSLAADVREKIDKVATDVLAKTGVPSASIAIVKDGRISYLQAYGDARLDPRLGAHPGMRYCIGSISKQFTAAAILLLQQQGKLSLDDKVSRFIPDLTRANEVTIRQLLSHTSGYQDYWPQDYVMPIVLKPTTSEKILDLWGRKALDFDPGTKWQYSNTNYVIAGVIVEKASGQSLMPFLQANIFTPLKMNAVANIDDAALGTNEPAGYLRYALGPLRPAPKEGKGWVFAAGELAMPAEDLAKWNISIMEQSLLQTASYREFEREIVLANGTGTNYGLGVSVDRQSGRRRLEHSGEVSGFTSENIVFPDDRISVTVLTNQDAATASGLIGRAITPLLFATADAATPQKLEQARKIFDGLQHGTLDRSLFTDNANSYFTKQALEDFASGLAPLGTPQDFTQTFQELRGGMTLRVYRIKFAQKNLRAWTYEMPDGKLEQYLVAATE
jgi:CubicO group peptidase (beta-lactamase class C family)